MYWRQSSGLALWRTETSITGKNANRAKTAPAPLIGAPIGASYYANQYYPYMLNSLLRVRRSTTILCTGVSSARRQGKESSGPDLAGGPFHDTRILSF
jgi:hypothetical protein